MLKISVIIPVYNASAFLKKAVESALQFEEVKEILLIEDCSRDDSLKVCQELTLEYSRVQLFQHPDKGNHGAGATRNLGLKKASQEFIAFLDADDYYLPNRFDAEKELFKNEKTEGVFGAIGTEFLTEKGKEKFKEKFNTNTLSTVNYVAEGQKIFEGFFGNGKFLGAFFSLIALTIRKSALERESLQFNEKLRVHQDSDFITKLMYHCHLQTGIIDQPISMRGVHDDNRITSVINYSEDYYNKQMLLAESRYNWAKEQKAMPKEILLNFRLSYLTYKIGLTPTPIKYFNFVWHALQNPKLFKTRYRFLALKKHG
ncbi:glycosyltransferase family 2 protein [Kaistella sp. G5-32]|uniref:Glycosyltransferase family 2 protein n=1 Tax=Kaistella gelatinilytica TaxID=2787636 RepID=A0ABS0FDH4_9FLAO|nr:glycosyltransferase family 2 protein [Kaistella gelatinilytica]MBF8457725.1 glycosyltransferase family 2 protein [Kaistella gelatinilytica]